MRVNHEKGVQFKGKKLIREGKGGGYTRRLEGC